MDFNNKKIAKNVIKLAVCIRKASRSDLLLLSAMIDVKTLNNEDFYNETLKLVDEISANPHLCALLGIKVKD